MKKITIGLIGYEANVPHRVGSNQYAFELMRALEKIDTTNEYRVFLPSRPLADLPRPRQGWQYVVAGPSRAWNWWGLPRALRRSLRLDLIFSPGHYAPFWSSVPTVVSVMDLGYLRFPGQFRYATYLQLKHWTAWSVRRAVRVLAISEFTRRDLIDTYHLAEKKVVTTPLGYDRIRFSPAISAGEVHRVAKKYHLPADYLLFVGTLKPSKNLLGLLEAFVDARRTSRRPLSLVIVGKKGWQYREIFSRVADLGLEKDVIFTGFVPDEDVPPLMKGAQLFILPSFWEGFGIPVLEAMAVGTPVVASEVASLPEIVGRAGVLVNPAQRSSLAAGILAGLSRRRELSRKGIQRAARFSWEACAKATKEALVQAADLPQTS